MSEWPNEHAWKVCLPQGNVGSNPTLSAKLRLLAANARAIASFSRPMFTAMWFVYILKSKSSEFIYIGSTNDLPSQRSLQARGMSEAGTPRTMKPKRE